MWRLLKAVTRNSRLPATITVRISIDVIQSLFLIGAFVAAVLGLSAFPRVSDPSQDYQTEVSHIDAHVADINAVWPGPNAGDRSRARVVMKGEQIIYEDGPTS